MGDFEGRETLQPEAKPSISSPRPVPADAIDTAPTNTAWHTPWSFRLVMLRYHRLVFRVAWNVLADAAEAEDVCQEVFTRYWQRQQQVERAKEWLLRVARNEAITRLRKRSKVVLNDLDTERIAEDDGVEPAQPDQLWHHDQRAQRLREAIATLPEPQRSLVVLFDLEGQDGATCAQVLDLTVNQVKVYLHRARKRLRQQLEHAL